MSAAPGDPVDQPICSGVDNSGGRAVIDVRGKNAWFKCPGCKALHRIPFEADEGPVWEWNGDAESPTFKPSLRVMWRSGDPDFPNEMCHSFIREGRIQFLGDCTHELAGKTVAMKEIPDGGLFGE